MIIYKRIIMASNKYVTLTEEEIDCILYDAREGDLETLTAIFEEIDPINIINIKDSNTLSNPIHMAAANGHTDVVKYLLSILPKEEALKLASSQNESGNTPLHWAAFNGHLPIIEILVEQYNVDVFLKNKSGHDAMYEAESNDHEDIENWFLKRFSVESDFKVEEDEENTKITYKPGTESKEAEERAKVAMNEKDAAEGLASKTEKLNI